MLSAAPARSSTSSVTTTSGVGSETRQPTILPRQDEHLRLTNSTLHLDQNLNCIQDLLQHYPYPTLICIKRRSSLTPPILGRVLKEEEDSRRPVLSPGDSRTSTPIAAHGPQARVVAA